MLEKFKELGDNKTLLNIGIDKWVMIALAGLLLLCSSSFFSENKNIKKGSVQVKQFEGNEEEKNEYVCAMEDELTTILESIKGVGKVKVMITVSNSGKQLVLREEPYTKEDEKEEGENGPGISRQNISKEDRVVMSSDENGNSVPYVVSSEKPVIQGVAVVAQGGGNINVVEKITDVIMALFNVSAHKISVIEMKG